MGNPRTKNPFPDDKLKSELEFNGKIFADSFNLLESAYKACFDLIKIASPDGAIQAVSEDRLLSLLRAVTHDLLRYASYQNIPFDDSKNRYKICPSVRAAVFTKWMMMMRPYMLDAIDNRSGSEKERWASKHCNELGAIFVASVAMSCILGRKTGESVLISDLMSNDEVNTFIYHLRHRIKHQDSYSLFYRRIKEAHA